MGMQKVHLNVKREFLLRSTTDCCIRGGKKHSNRKAKGSDRLISKYSLSMDSLFIYFANIT